MLLEGLEDELGDKDKDALDEGERELEGDREELAEVEAEGLKEADTLTLAELEGLKDAEVEADTEKDCIHIIQFSVVSPVTFLYS